jgi:hypothetical protein
MMTTANEVGTWASTSQKSAELGYPAEVRHDRRTDRYTHRYQRGVRSLFRDGERHTVPYRFTYRSASFHKPFQTVPYRFTPFSRPPEKLHLTPEPPMAH